MDIYDVVIVGGGPAGLKCAEGLGKTDKSVLLLEKNSIFGNKICAGGITRKDMAMLDLPGHLIQQQIYDASLFSPHNRSTTHTQSPLLYTVNRRDLGDWQLSRLRGSGVTVHTLAMVNRIDSEKVTLRDGTSYGYRYLVGADGYASLVRRHLDLPVKKRLIGMQYILACEDVNPVLEIYLDSRYFKSWYAWIFPHQNSLAVGCCCDPRFLKASRLRKNFHEWLGRKGIQTSGTRMESGPISYDYRGIRFGNIFLAGEAAGLGSGLSGEGIYQALVSGQEVARMIIDPDYVSEPMKRVVRFNAIQNRFMQLMYRSGILRGLFIELILVLMNNRYIRTRISNAFS